MKRAFIGLFLVFISLSSAFGQLEEKMEKYNVVKGAIISKGEKVEGYIKDASHTVDGPSPWRLQSEIQFISKEDFEKLTKIKKKNFKKYEPKDCDGFIFDTLTYLSVKYADMSAIGTNMIPKKMFIRKALDGQITLFYYYDTPPSIGNINEIEQAKIDCAKPKLVYRIGDSGKLKSIGNLNIEKELSDCPMVVEKQKNGEYKIVGKEDEKASTGNKVFNNVAFRGEVRLMAIMDYNNNCGK